MNSPWIKSLLAGLILTCISFPLVAQQDNSNGGLVAILDVAKVFKDNPVFDTKMKAIKAEADALKKKIQDQQELIRKDAAGLEEFGVGTPERNNLEASLEQRQAALRTQARQAEADLLAREAGIYYDTYTEMQTVVAKLANQYGISLVMRFDSAPISRDNRPEVIQAVNRTIVYHHKVDLTGMVIQAMNPAS
ncbi:MAG: OmpH family outer membrane protein, partial [Planctomycetota bacterium]|nr:OmpH family outer membrane protein [Planctomycetota bacterium]